MIYDDRKENDNNNDYVNNNNQDWEAQRPRNLEDGSEWVLRPHPGPIFFYSLILVFSFSPFDY